MPEQSERTNKRSWRCFFGFHQWTKWIDGTATARSVFIKEPHEVDVQQRRCTVCNYAETRLV